MLKIKLKESLDKFMVELKKENPDANWGNLLTGIIILLFIAFLSIWYFGNPSDNTIGSSSSDANGLDNNMFVSDKETIETTTVLKSEGLWHVAKRVCGNGESYNILATANNLTVRSTLKEGQVLKVVCSK